MKENSKIQKFASLEVTYDPSLDSDDDKVYFPKKVARAQELLEKYYVPTLQKTAKKPKNKNGSLPLTDLQKELLEIYALQPSDEQMTALKAFLNELFGEKPLLKNTVKEQELELAA